MEETTLNAPNSLDRDRTANNTICSESAWTRHFFSVSFCLCVSFMLSLSLSLSLFISFIIHCSIDVAFKLFHLNAKEIIKVYHIFTLFFVRTNWCQSVFINKFCFFPLEHWIECNTVVIRMRKKIVKLCDVMLRLLSHPNILLKSV